MILLFHSFLQILTQRYKMMFSIITFFPWMTFQNKLTGYYDEPSISVKCFNPLSANPTKWSNTLKQFVGRVCLTILWGGAESANV